MFHSSYSSFAPMTICRRPVMLMMEPPSPTRWPWAVGPTTRTRSPTVLSRSMRRMRIRGATRRHMARSVRRVPLLLLRRLRRASSRVLAPIAAEARRTLFASSGFLVVIVSCSLSLRTICSEPNVFCVGRCFWSASPGFVCGKLGRFVPTLASVGRPPQHGPEPGPNGPTSSRLKSMGRSMNAVALLVDRGSES
jgi:hypothetical protein